MNKTKIIYSTKNDQILIDSEDYDKIKNYNWRYDNRGVYTFIKRKMILLTKMILDRIDKKDYIYHIDGNKLNNRKNNLSIGNKSNLINKTNENAIIYIQGKECLIDLEDIDLVKKYTWNLDKDGYAVAYTRRDEKGKQYHLRMHRLIMDCPENKIIDHINHNVLDNRKENLRICTYKDNARYRLKTKNTKCNYKGLYYDSITKVWVVRLRYKEKHLCIGTFTDEISAANAYNYYAKKYYKEFAYFNDVKFMPKKEWEKNKKENKEKISKYRGVAYIKKNNKWLSCIHKDKIRYNLGYYDNEIDAAKAYNKKAIELYGEKFNKLNIITK